jgi:hypothetical protein
VTVICLTLAVNYLTRKIPAFQAVILGTLITSVSWIILVFRPTIWGAILSLFVLALGEITQQPRYYEYIALLAPPGQQGTYMGFAFLADRDWVADRRMVRRHAPASFRRSHAPTGAHVVGGDCSRRGDDIAVMALR